VLPEGGFATQVCPEEQVADDALAAQKYFEVIHETASALVVEVVHVLEVLVQLVRVLMLCAI
jgi:hypothetical protein